MLGKTTYTRVIIITAIITGAALVIAALIWLLTGTVGLGAPASGGRDRVSVDQHASLSVEGISTLSIETTSADVRVIEGTGDTVEARLYGVVSAPDVLPLLVTGREGRTARVEVRDPSLKTGLVWWDVRLEVAVPAGYAGKCVVRGKSSEISVADHAYAGLDVSTSSGDIKAGAISATGDIALQATSGDVAASALRAAGDVSVRTSSGSVIVEALDARNASLSTTSGEQKVKAVAAQGIELASSSGDIRVQALSGSVTVSTHSGSVGVECAAVPPKMDVEATSGDVTVELPADAVFTLDAHSSSGDVTCAFPITVTLADGTASAAKHTLSGTVGVTGTKAPSISVRTTSGDVRIKR